MPVSGPISIPYIRSRISLGSSKNGKGSVQSDGGTILIIGVSGRIEQNFRLCLIKSAQIFCLAVLRCRYFERVGRWAKRRRVRARHFRRSRLDRLKRELYFVRRNKSRHKLRGSLNKVVLCLLENYPSPSPCNVKMGPQVIDKN